MKTGSLPSAPNNPYYVRQNHFDSQRMAGSVPKWQQGDDIASASSEGQSSTQSLSLADDKQGHMHPNIKAPSLSFGEFLDIINPLQHLPIVGSIYRSVTGDDISPVAQIMGGTLYGGPLGGVTSLANAMMQEHADEDSLASAMISTARSDHPTYDFQEESRTAGV